MVGPPVDNHPMKVSMNEETTLAQFEQTIVPHLNEAYNLAAGLTRNKDDAEDVVQ
jgi:DNA-directed RNA polymerase specialized sigma24 family protein